MGRKAIRRQRKENSDKTLEWIKILFPYFQENGLKGITMDLVAKQLNKSKTTLYDYFQTKEELLEMMVDLKLQQIQGFEIILNDTSLSYSERCTRTLEDLMYHISDISTLFLTDLRELHPELWHKIEEFLDFTASQMEGFYAEGIGAKEFNPIHTKILSMTDRIFFRTLSDPDFLNKQGLTVKEAFEQYLNLKYYGLLKEKK